MQNDQLSIWVKFFKKTDTFKSGRQIQNDVISVGKAGFIDIIMLKIFMWSWKLRCIKSTCLG